VYFEESSPAERPHSPKADSKDKVDKHQVKPERWIYVDDMKEEIAVPLQPLIPPRAFVW
jgi:hypothetical protein